MPIKRPAETPQRSRKRPRVPKFNESNEQEQAAVVRPQEEDEEEDIQADYEEEGGYHVEDIYIPPKLALAERPMRGERLIIEKIECENFKSYGGIKVMGPFHKSFSAIVGPNGNGKSNIIDAMLFVFGYRAKKIRCKKVSVLIHKSELLPKVNSCAVTVHFVKINDNGDEDYTDELNRVPNSEIRVCRRAYLNNSSAYWLNEKRVQFTDVATFLKRNGIDIVHNRFLILQGEVEQIAQMPPKATNTHETGFLEFIDEVIGTKRYETPLIRLKTRVEELEMQREEKSQRVNLAAQHKESLVEPMKKAVLYLRDKNNKIRTHHTLTQRKALDRRQIVADKTEKLKDVEENRNAVVTRLGEIKAVNDVRKKEYAEAEKAYQTAEAKFKKNKKAMDDADAKYVQLNREMKSSNEERKKKMKEIEKFAEELEKLQGLPQRHEAEISKLEKRKAELDSDIEKEDKATRGDVERLMKKVEECVAEKKTVEAKFRKLKAEFDEKTAARDTLKKELDRSQSNQEAEKAKLEKLKQELKELEKTVQRKSGEGMNVQADTIPRKEAEAQKKKAKAKELLTVEYEKRATFQRLRSKLADAQESMDGGMMTDRVDKALFAEKAKGLFPGLYGRMKDLATIDEKYNVAATVASGMLDYWVVDTDSTGADCIQFLKDRKLPAQSFVCVNKQGHLQNRCRQAFRTPADSLRIFDLLKIVKPELTPVFYKAYYDTLVAENIDIASKVAYGGSQRFRVVSCQGDIIETTGSLLGGGTKITQGKFNSGMAKRLGGAVSKKEMDALRENCAAGEAELKEIMDSRRALEEEASALETEIQQIKMKINNYQSDLEASRKMIPMKAAQISEQENKIKQSTLSPKVLQEKGKKIEQADAELEKLKEPYEDAESDVKNLIEKIKSLQEDKKKEILKKLDKFKEQHKRVIQELDKLKIELRNCSKNKTKLENKSAKAAEEKEALERRMLNMNEEKKQLEAGAIKLKEEEEALRNDKEEKEKLYNEQKAQANEFDAEEKKLNKQKVTIDNNHQTLTNEVRAFEREATALTASLETFKLETIPEEEVLPLEIFSDEQLQEFNVKELEGKLSKYTNRLKREEPNLNVLEDYKVAIKTLEGRIAEFDAIDSRRKIIRDEFLKLEVQRMQEFMDGYAMISSKVKELFRMISMGGDAELDLLDSSDPFSCGIDFSVRPRGKTWKKIINLSGGEKTLSSLALVFSLHHFKPSPFYVMDEIDAALDFQNVSIIANYIKDRTKFTQFIIISLRSNMFELADSLLGVYKVDNMSYSIRMGVNTILNKLKDVHRDQNKQFLMGSSDDTQASRKQTTVASQASQASTERVASQQTVVAGSSKSPSARPNLDISDIQDPDASVETQRVSGPSKPSNGDTTKEPNSNNDSDQSMEVSDELFVDSFNEGITDRDRGPLAASTPFVGGGSKQRTSPGNNIPSNQDPQEEDSSDESEVDAIFESFSSSANESQSQP